MDRTSLASFIKQPEVHKHILGSYSGAYSMGVTLDPANGNQAAIRVCVEGSDSTAVATHIVRAGQRIPIIVNTHFTAPQPLANR